MVSVRGSPQQGKAAGRAPQPGSSLLLTTLQQLSSGTEAELSRTQAGGGGSRRMALRGIGVRSSSLHSTILMRRESNPANTSAWLDVGVRLRFLPCAQGPGCPAPQTGPCSTLLQDGASTSSMWQLCSIRAARPHTASPLPLPRPQPQPGSSQQWGALLTPCLAGTMSWMCAGAAISQPNPPHRASCEEETAHSPVLVTRRVFWICSPPRTLCHPSEAKRERLPWVYSMKSHVS